MAAASALCLLSARLLKMLAMCWEAAAAAAVEGDAALPGSEAGRESMSGGGVSAAEGKRQLPPPPSEPLLNSSRILVGCDLRLLDILREEEKAMTCEREVEASASLQTIRFY